MTTTTKTRFAPSPTGLIHLGNVRTSLFNWLLARGQQGVFLLRIEDTDKERSKPEFIEAVQEDLSWLGLAWQEGPVVGGDSEPYCQSERQSIYDDYYQQLLDNGQAYPCFCTPQELSLSRKVQRAAGKAPRYAGTCARLSAEEVEKKKQEGLEYTLRFRVPGDRNIEFTDLVRGKQSFAPADIGDFIIRRSDGSPSFFFSNAIDDALMNVTHILRGEDHLTNTPRQKLILEALGLRIPEYGHISLIVGDDGTPLSKRHGSMSVQELRERGYLPLAVLNYLARLGHHYSQEGFMTVDELAGNFDIAHLGKAPAKFQSNQLLYWQHEVVQKLDDQALWDWIADADTSEIKGTVTTLVPETDRLHFAHTVRENLTFPEDAVRWAANLYSESGEFADNAAEEIRAAGQAFYQAALDSMTTDSADFKTLSKSVGTATGNKGKKLFMPLRAAISGELYAAGAESDWKQGPQMVALWNLLGTERIQRRLQLALDLCK